MSDACGADDEQRALSRAHAPAPVGERVTVRFWAGARRAAGRTEEPMAAGSLGEIRQQLAVRPELAAIVRASSFLVDGVSASDDAPLRAGAVIDVLPPFAGGAGLACGPAT